MTPSAMGLPPLSSNSQAAKRLRTGIEVDRDERRQREGMPAMSLAEQRENYALFEAEEKTNTLCRQLQESRHKRQEGRFSRAELV